MSVTVDYISNLTVKETLETNVASVTRPVIVHDAYNTYVQATDTTAPDVTDVSSFQMTMTGSAMTIDLTAVATVNNLSFNGTGLIVEYVKFIADDMNAGGITIEEHPTNGYELLGSGFSFDLAINQEMLIKCSSLTPIISSTSKNIRVTGVADDILKVIIVFGTIGS